jgi:hypothetical protein
MVSTWQGSNFSMNRNLIFTSDEVTEAFLKQGGSAWVLRTNQVGGLDPALEPIPTYSRKRSIMPAIGTDKKMLSSPETRVPIKSAKNTTTGLRCTVFCMTRGETQNSEIPSQKPNRKQRAAESELMHCY